MIAKSELTSTVIYIVVGVFLAFSLQAFFGFALNTELPIVAVQSNSMVPTFYKGDLLILKGIDGNNPDIEAGDIIVFSHTYGDTPVVHRIVAINDDGTYQTKGDANAGQLPYEKRIDISQVKGKSILIIPYLGWIKIAVVEVLLPLIAKHIIFIALTAIGIYFLDTLRRKNLKRKNH